MSHYSKIQTQFAERDILLTCLAKLGYNNVEVNAQPKHLFGYMGDPRPESAEVVIRRQHISPSSNDIGFRLKPDGMFEAIISEYDLEVLGAGWLQKLTQSYAQEAVYSSLSKQGFTVQAHEFDQATGKIHLVMKREKEKEKERTRS